MGPPVEATSLANVCSLPFGSIRRTRPQYQDCLDGTPRQVKHLKIWHVKGWVEERWEDLKTSLEEMLRQRKDDHVLDPPPGREGYCEPAFLLRCFLVGIDSNRVSPHVAVCCGYDWYAKGLKALITKSGILGTGLFRDFRACFCVITPIYLTSTQSGLKWGTLPDDLTDVLVMLDNHKLNGTLCGARFNIPSPEMHQGATIGGLIRLGDQYGAMTVAHIFYRESLPSEPSTGPAEWHVEELDVEAFGTDPTQIEDMSDLQQDLPLLPNTQPVERQSTERAIKLGRLWEISESRSSPADTRLDWALVRIDNKYLQLPNKMSTNNFANGARHQISSSVKERPKNGTQVQIQTARGVIPGQIANTTVALKVPSCSGFQPVWIVRTNSIQRGDSGSWVLEATTDKLIGMVVGACDEFQEIYILPAVRIFEDIQARSGLEPQFPALQPGEQAVLQQATPLETGQFEFVTSDVYDRLFWLTRTGHMHTVRSLLRSGAINLKVREHGRTLLSIASELGHEAVVRLLLDTAGLVVDLPDCDGRTALSLAAEMGELSIIQLLIDTGKADPNIRDKENRTPLLHAVEHGHDAIAKLIFDSGLCEDNLKLVPAAKYRRRTVVEVLSSKSEASINQKDVSGRSALLWAAEHRDHTTVRALLYSEQIDVNSRDLTGRSPLAWAANNGDQKTARLLLDSRKIDANAKDQNGLSPLTWAAKNGDEKTAWLLPHSEHVDTKSRDRYGQTPITWTVKNDHEAVARLLLETGQVDFDSIDNDGRSPLSWAAQYNKIVIVDMLLSTGKVEPDSLDKDGRSPLSWAAQYNSLAVVDLLLGTGKVEPDSRDKEGRSPLSWAAQHNNAVIVQLLLETKRVDIHSKDNNGNSPLSWALMYRNRLAVVLLLERQKVETSAIVKDSCSPLLWVSSDAAVRKLLKHMKSRAYFEGQRGTALSCAGTYGNSFVDRKSVWAEEVETDA